MPPENAEKPHDTIRIAIVGIVIPWPDKPLWPNRNKGKHWSYSNKERQQAKETGFWLTQERMQAEKPPSNIESLCLIYEFYPPTKGIRDIHDNGPLACKPYVDGMFSALGIDDSLISESQSYMRSAYPPYGKVVLSLFRKEKENGI